MALKLHGTPGSTCTGRVLATMFEKGATDFELVKVDLQAGQQKTPAFLAMQENIGAESRAIARYICSKFDGQGTPLYGSNLKDRSLVEQWMEVESQNYNPPISAIVNEKVFKPAKGLQTDETIVHANLEKFGKVLDIYEAHLSKNKYLVGDFFSLADVSHLSYTHYLINCAKMGNIVDARPHVKAWWESISNRPSWKKVVALSAAK